MLEKGNSMSEISLLIADDHRMFREGVCSICEIIGNFKILGEAENGFEAVALAEKLSPDIILMDINMPKLDGVKATMEITRRNSSAKVIILTMFNQDNHLFDAIKAGARGYILKDASGEELINSIRSVYEGYVALPPEMAVKVLEEFRQLSKSNHQTTHIENLTPGEMDVIRLVAQGMDNRGIASALQISGKTVSNRLNEIFSKLHVNNRTQAALHALRQGWANLYPEDEKPNDVI